MPIPSGLAAEIDACAGRTYRALRALGCDHPIERRVSRVATIELLYFPDCPNWRVADERVRLVADRHGVTVAYRLVESAEEADSLGFRGSPTILIDGHDPFATGDEPFGLACRLFVTPDGPAGAPTVEQLERALGQR